MLKMYLIKRIKVSKLSILKKYLLFYPFFNAWSNANYARQKYKIITFGFFKFFYES